MKNRHYVLFALILVVLLVVYWHQSKSSRITELKTGYVVLFPDLDTKKVEKIQAYRPPDPQKGLILVRNKERWFVENKFGARAEEYRVSKFLEQLGKLKGELRSQDPKTFPVFWLEKEKALHVILSDGQGNKLAHFLVGKKGEGGKTCFIRKVDQNQVYYANVNLVSTFQTWERDQQPPVLRWCNLLVKPLQDWSKVVRLEITLPGHQVVFEKRTREDKKGKSKEEWVKVKPAGGPALDPNTILSLVNAILGMRGEDVLDPAQRQSLHLESAPYRAKVSLKEGEQYELLVVPLDPDYCATAKGERDLLLISRPTFDRSFGRLKNLLEGKKEKQSPEPKPRPPKK